MARLRLVQLPVPPPAALAGTGNVPLAAGCLAVAARVHALPMSVEVTAPDVTDRLGDVQLAEHVAADAPEYVGLSLYLWNAERSLHLAREIKRRSPDTVVLIGGPEVGPDNPFVCGQEGFDVAVTGEAEPVFAEVMRRLLDGGVAAAEGVPGVAVRGASGLGAFTAAHPADFPLASYPSPYLDGTVPVDGDRSTYIESVRGCRSSCTYCFYPRSSGVLRTLDVDATARLIADVRDRGARDISFLDPTFNHRPGFEALVAALARENVDRQMSFFAEIRSEGLTAAHAKSLAQAGFDRLEIGLQSVNRETLKRVKRFGDPDKLAAAAKMLRGEGITLLVDLIVGLPGDTPDDVFAGVDFLQEHGLADEAQVFRLSILPGTAMRADAVAQGVTFDPAPPYHVRTTATMDRDTLAATLFEAERRLGRRLDESPRPHLVEGGDDVLVLDVDRPTPMDRPGARHQALWLTGRDLAARSDVAMAAIDARLAVDPYATLDVVLAPTNAPPVSFVAAVRARLASGVRAYSSRALSWRGEDGMRRITAVRRAGVVWPDAATAALTEIGPLFVEVSAAEAVDRRHDIGGDGPCVRVIGDVDARQFAMLAADADPECVAFADRATEARWQSEVVY